MAFGSEAARRSFVDLGTTKSIRRTSLGSGLLNRLAGVARKTGILRNVVAIEANQTEPHEFYRLPHHAIGHSSNGEEKPC
jgi:hypothetical protein